MVGGGGGGRADFAQAGGKEPGKITAALQRAEELVRQVS
jgi:alanyl-tRNA synthetase